MTVLCNLGCWFLFASEKILVLLLSQGNILENRGGTGLFMILLSQPLRAMKIKETLPGFVSRQT